MGTVTYPTLEHVAMQARPYPTYLLDGCETGLCLFSAAFLGHNDAVHFAEAGLLTTCVDSDGERLSEMQELYPEEWGFFEDDAWEFAERWLDDVKWDVVSVDTFTGETEQRSLKSLGLWCALAEKAVTVTVTNQQLGTYTVPAGWTDSLYARTAGVFWLVLKK
ncbi:MAG: hypothetical protein H0W31_00240 [Actinobacteria bacterium]|nr:hypothetical protein [Actinomycetota bacterium]